MSKKPVIYAPEFRQQMVELHLAGRSLGELSREFGCGSSTIGHWVKSARQRPVQPLPAGQLNQAERDELSVLRKRVKQLETERDILSKGDEDQQKAWEAVCMRNAWFANNGAPTSTSSTR